LSVSGRLLGDRGLRLKLIGMAKQILEQLRGSLGRT
jgi:hypothetical protein